MRVLFAIWVGVLLFIPTATADATVDATVSRTIVLTPASGAPGEALAVTGSGWSSAFGRVSVWLDSGGAAPPLLLASATVDRRGAVNGTGVVPRLGVGSHRVAACQGCLDGVQAERMCATGASADHSCAMLLIVFLATRSISPSGIFGDSAGAAPSSASSFVDSPSTDAGALPSPSWRPALTASALAVTAALVVLIVGVLVLRRRAPPPPVHVERKASGRPAEPTSDGD